MIDARKLEALLQKTINLTPDIPGVQKISGKVRESYLFNNGTRAIVVTDRISAFDKILGTVPLKGQVLNSISNFWFEEIHKIGIRSHHISSPHPNVTINREAKVLPIEFVVRGYLTGSTITSSWYAYNNHDQMICGIKMPDNMVKNQQFPEHILTPTTKAEAGGRDINISRQEILDQNIVPQDIYEKAENTALTMFAHGQKIAAEKGLILVDTKYEMGLDENGELIIVDEVHTPDSSRYWIRETYENRINNGEEPDSLDKEFVRNMIVDAGYDVDSSEDPSKYMTDELRIEAAKKYLALLEIFTASSEIPEAQKSLDQVIREAASL